MTNGGGKDVTPTRMAKGLNSKGSGGGTPSTRNRQPFGGGMSTDMSLEPMYNPKNVDSSEDSITGSLPNGGVKVPSPNVHPVFRD